MRMRKELRWLLWGLWLVCLVVAVWFVVAVIMLWVDGMQLNQLQN
ncbi:MULTISPECIES: hypothetical protein [unclassified Streptomyces]|nr:MULTISPECIES: hypothetical protein [unclassified Streptomyces]MCX5049835.1 hypothetical protein [Streptomyces sp. NBC_00474]MCX5060261.1 hypothetical protein [Streptomyces sp. NBC_00452]MCX5247743.1 hypothetical protein [Streptomyces sp. NBC_00201]MCX5286447.1 hypothetical protein [Streptomyces sp. NBC_00183]